MNRHLVALFYVVEPGPGPLVVAETGRSTRTTAWRSLTSLPTAQLSPAAIDALGMFSNQDTHRTYPR
ncbi:hypothetical protein [Streptomyces sp. NPDC048473]|uniref:hypothetical protein n=1 Tax=unclassified Streptomyces TaxID=2593676 RepID=UPI0037240AD6